MSTPLPTIFPIPPVGTNPVNGDQSDTITPVSPSRLLFIESSNLKSTLIVHLKHGPYPLEASLLSPHFTQPVSLTSGLVLPLSSASTTCSKKVGISIPVPVRIGLLTTSTPP